MHELVQLAKNAIMEYVKRRVIISPPEQLSQEMREKAGVFVSLKKGKELRGCIGTFTASSENVAREVIKNAVLAATEDPRFSPVTPGEIEEISFSVDILSQPERVNDASQLDAKNYGIIVMKGSRKGLLLPDLEGIDTSDEQIRIAKMKAGIDSKENDIEIFRFFVRRYH